MLIGMEFDLAAHIRQVRAEQGLTQSQLAELAGINQGDLSRIEAGDRDPRWSTIMRISAALGEAIKIETPSTQRRPLSPESRSQIKAKARNAKLDLSVLEHGPIAVKR